MENRVNDDNDQSLADKLNQRIDKLAEGIERIRLVEFGELLDNPRRLFMVNFMAGLARGLGMAVGFTILAAIMVIILQRVVSLNLPIIGQFIANIARVVQEQMGP